MYSDLSGTYSMNNTFASIDPRGVTQCHYMYLFRVQMFIFVFKIEVGVVLSVPSETQNPT